MVNVDGHSDDQDVWRSIISSKFLQTNKYTKAFVRQFLHRIEDIRHERQIDQTVALLSDEDRSLIQIIRRLYAIHRYGGVSAYNRDLGATCQRSLMFASDRDRVGIGFHATLPEDEVVLIDG